MSNFPTPSNETTTAFFNTVLYKLFKYYAPDELVDLLDQMYADGRYYNSRKTQHVCNKEVVLLCEILHHIAIRQESGEQWYDIIACTPDGVVEILPRTADPFAQFYALVCGMHHWAYRSRTSVYTWSYGLVESCDDIQTNDPKRLKAYVKALLRRFHQLIYTEHDIIHSSFWVLNKEYPLTLDCLPSFSPTMKAHHNAQIMAEQLHLLLEQSIVDHQPTPTPEEEIMDTQQQDNIDEVVSDFIDPTQKSFSETRHPSWMDSVRRINLLVLHTALLYYNINDVFAAVTHNQDLFEGLLAVAQHVVKPLNETFANPPLKTLLDDLPEKERTQMTLFLSMLLTPKMCYTLYPSHHYNKEVFASFNEGHKPEATATFKPLRHRHVTSWSPVLDVANPSGHRLTKYVVTYWLNEIIATVEDMYASTSSVAPQQAGFNNMWSNRA